MLGAYKVRAQMDMDGMEAKNGDNLSIANTFNLLSKQKTIELLDEQTPEGETNWFESLKDAVDEFKEKKKRIREHQQSITNQESGISECHIGERAPRWIPDESATICMRCDASFTTFRRRHHCRGCGWVICSRCCKKAPLEYLHNKIARVCHKCYNVILRQNSTDVPDSPIKSPKKKDCLAVKASDDNIFSSYLNMSVDKGKNWMRRYFAVHKDFVLYSFRSDQDDSALTHLPLPGFQVSVVKNIHDKTNIFTIYHKDYKVYHFQADDKHQVKKWVNVLEKVVRAELPDITQRLSTQSTCSSTSSASANSDTCNNNSDKNNSADRSSAELENTTSTAHSETSVILDNKNTITEAVS